MASSKYVELQGHSDEDLTVELNSARREYQQMRFDNYTKGIESAAKIRELRRDIARIKTEVRRRELAAMNDGAGRARRLSRRARTLANQS